MKILKTDAHVDTIEYAFDSTLSLNNRKLSFNLEDIDIYLPYIQFFANFVHDKYINRGYDRVNKILDYYEKQALEHNVMHTVKNKRDIEYVIKNNKLGAILTVENGTALDGKLDNIYNLFKRGIRLMTITWNYENKLGCGNESIFDTGLTKLGKKCVDIMNNIGMIVDISHASTKTFWDIMSVSNKPVIASHSNAYELCNNKRNLTDEQIKEISKNNGIIGITYYSYFLNNTKRACINDVVNHIEYISNLIGTQFVCLGSDFDGVDKNYLPENLKGVKDVYKLEECMLYRGFSIQEIQNILGGNMFNFLLNNFN